MADHESTPSGRSSDQLRLLAEELVLALPAVEDALDEVARTAASVVGRSCGITYLTRYGVLTVASSDSLANAVDELQYGTGDGPCLQALRTGETVRVEDVLTEARWGDYPALAAQAGIRSSLSYPVIVDEIAVGAVNFYSTSTAAWTADSEAAGLLLSFQVAGILGAVRGIAMELVADPSRAQAFAERHEVDIACGILMAQRGCSNPDARTILAADAARRGVPIRAVVTELLGRAAPIDPP
jgi:putative methionine-R-sulfoxide reductase with GAF domain